MALDTFVLVAAQYDNQEDALADYDAVRAVYKELDIIDTYDAAVVSKDAERQGQDRQAPRTADS